MPKKFCQEWLGKHRCVQFKPNWPNFKGFASNAIRYRTMQAQCKRCATESAMPEKLGQQ